MTTAEKKQRDFDRIIKQTIIIPDNLRKVERDLMILPKEPDEPDGLDSLDAEEIFWLSRDRS